MRSADVFGASDGLVGVLTFDGLEQFVCENPILGLKLLRNLAAGATLKLMNGTYLELDRLWAVSKHIPPHTTHVPPNPGPPNPTQSDPIRPDPTRPDPTQSDPIRPDPI